MEINVLTGIVIDLCIKIHSKIGPGCFEKVYEEILYHELIKIGLKVERQLLLPVRYDDMLIDNAYKLDLLVEDACTRTKICLPVATCIFQTDQDTTLAFKSQKRNAA